MRALSRPMFNMGGPIKQGVMHGIREPKKHGGSMSESQGKNLVGDPVYPKTGGREHHAIFGGLGIGALIAGGARLAPWAARAFGNIGRGYKAAKYIDPKAVGFWQKARSALLPTKRFTQMGGGEGTGGFRLGAFANQNPALAFTAASSVPQAGYLGYKAAKAAPGALWEGTKRYADMVIPGDQSHWYTETPEIKTVPGVPGGGSGGRGGAMYYDKTKPKKLSERERLAFANKQRNERVQKYLDLMGYDRSKKTAIADALIDASKIVGDRGTLKGKNITQELINPIIQATSKRFDKPDQIREAVGLMATKAEIEKDLSAETDALAKKLTLTKIKQGEKALEEGVGIDLLTYIGSQKGKVKSAQLERVARLSANRHGHEFTKVTDEKLAQAPEGASEEEIIQSVVGDDGVYMVGDAIIQVTGGVPKQLV